MEKGYSMLDQPQNGQHEEDRGARVEASDSESQKSPERETGSEPSSGEEAVGMHAADDEVSDDSPVQSEKGQDLPEEISSKRRQRKKRRKPRHDAQEQRLLGRRAMCKAIEDIAPHMLKTVKLRVLGRYLESTKGMNDDALTARIVKDAHKIAHRRRIVENLARIDPDVNRRNLKEILIFAVLLQEEFYALEENRLEEKVIQYEKDLVTRAQTLDFFDRKQHDAQRWHHYDTYRIVLEAAWRNEDDVSRDEASLLRVLRDHLSISREEHWLIGAHLKRFPKAGCALHTADDIHDARKELQRDSILWSYRDENSRNMDVIPGEVVSVLREDVLGLELQETNYRRILQHDSIRLSDLRRILQSRDMDRYGNKAELVERIVFSDIKPTTVLGELDRAKVSDMCRLVGLKSSGNKPALIERLVQFYDDLTFQVIETEDEREEWYNNYELLATRSYADLKAKKLIGKDLEIEHKFENATDFLFETKLHLTIDTTRKVTKADGRILLPDKQVILWDCKSVEGSVDLQQHLEDQFDSYLRKEREKGNKPLAFLVVGPSFTKPSLKLAYQYKARTNWDIALVRTDALKYLAEQWSTTEPNKPFPIRLFNRTELIDRERVEFLHSLA